MAQESFTVPGTIKVDGVTIDPSGATTGSTLLRDGLSVTSATETPVGTIIMYVGSIGASPTYSGLPSGWLLCDGATFSSSTYPSLATVVGDMYGTSSGGTYYLPNFVSKSPVGHTQSSGDTTSGWSGSVATSSDGATTHTHISAHGSSASTLNHGHTSPGGAAAHTHTVTDAKGTHTHGNTDFNVGSHTHSYFLANNSFSTRQTGASSDDHTHNSTNANANHGHNASDDYNVGHTHNSSNSSFAAHTHAVNVSAFGANQSSSSHGHGSANINKVFFLIRAA